MKNQASRLTAVFKHYSGLPQGIYILFTINIIAAMGNFVFPFLTLFLTGKIGISAKETSWFLTSCIITSALGSLLGGKLTDHWGRKNILIISQLFCTLFYLPCAFMGNTIIIAWILIPVSIFNGAAQPVLGAMVNDLTIKDNRNQAFSLLYLGNNIGFAIGSFIAGSLFSEHTPWIFLINAITCIVVFFTLFFFVAETIPKKEDEETLIQDDEKTEEGNLFDVLLKRKNLFVFLLVSVVFSFCYAQYPFCIPIQLNSIFIKNGAQVFGDLMMTNGLVVIFMTTFIIFLTRRINPLLNVVLSGVFFAIGFGMLYYASSFQLFIISTIIWTIGEILSTTNSGVYIANHTPKSHRGRFNSLRSISYGLGSACGPVIMGLYIQGRGARSAWPLIFTLEILAAFSIYILYTVVKQSAYPPASQINIKI